MSQGFGGDMVPDCINAFYGSSNFNTTKVTHANSQHGSQMNSQMRNGSNFSSASGTKRSFNFDVGDGNMSIKNFID